MQQDFPTPVASVKPPKNFYIVPGGYNLITHHKNRGIPQGDIGENDTIGFCASGLAFLHINGQNLLLRPNQLVFSPSGTPRARTALTEDLIIHEYRVYGSIEDKNIFEFLKLRDGNYIVDVPPKFLPATKECIDDISCFSQHVEDYLFRIGSVSRLLGIYFAARVEREESEQKFKDVLDYMQAHIASNVTLQELADVVHMQPTYFIRAFKKMFQQSPIAYYNSLRIAKAFELLSDTEIPLEDVGKSIGIEDRYYFSTFFKTQSGKSPDFFRKAIKNILSGPGIEKNCP